MWPPEELEEGEEEPPPPWDPDWVDVRTADIDNTSIVTGYFGGGLQIDLPDGSFRGTGARYRLPGDPVDEVWFPLSASSQRLADHFQRQTSWSCRSLQRQRPWVHTFD